MQQHHTNVDPCKEYKLSKAPAVLARVRAGNKTCSICSRVLSSTQSLRNHICSAHMDETCYQCDKCGKSFGDSYVLQVHYRKHQPEGKPQWATVGHSGLCHSGPQDPAYGGPSWEVSPMPVLWDNIHSHKVACWA